MVALAMEQPKILLLAWDKITADPRCQARVSIPPRTVDEYAEALKAGAVFPAVVVFFDGTTYWLADGFTRREAFRRAKRKHTDAIVKDGGIRDAMLFAVGANIKHGARRTNEDKHRAVRIMLFDPEWRRWSNQEIARRCGVSHPVIASERRILKQIQDTRIVMRNGREYEMDTEDIGTLSEAERFEQADVQARAIRDKDKYRSGWAKTEKLVQRAKKKAVTVFGEDASDFLEAMDDGLLCLEKLR